MPVFRALVGDYGSDESITYYVHVSIYPIICHEHAKMNGHVHALPWQVNGFGFLQTCTESLLFSLMAR